MAKDHRQSADADAIKSGPKLLPQPALKAKWTWLLLLSAFGALAIWAYWPSLGDICAAWTSNPDYTHGFFVVPISIWLLWVRRNHAPKFALSPHWRGLLLLAAAGSVRIIAGRLYLPQLDAWSIPLWVAGVVWLLFGWATLRWALPSIAFLWFATPLPGTIETILSTPLQTIASQCAAFVLRVVGQPAIAEGTTILLDDQVLDVERACSGLRMFYGIFALAVACIALARPARWKAVLVLMTAAPVAICANVVRIVGTGVLMKYASTEAAQKFSHDIAGLVMIPFAVALFLLFLFILGRVVHRLQEPGAVAWLTKWGLGGIVLAAGFFFWGRHQEVRAITTLRDTASRYETEKNWSKSIQYLSRYIRAMPEDYDSFSHLAELYQAHALAYQDQLRAVELLRNAWQQQPDREDLALGAIRLALQNQDHDNAISLCGELLSHTSQPKTRAAATKLRAQALLAYLQSDVNRGNYTWDNVKEAFEKALQLPDYDVPQASILAEIYRQRISSIAKDQREKRANALMDRVVAERANDPMAWLARYQYRFRYAPDKPAATDAEKDLDRALALVDKEPHKPEFVLILLVAAGRATERNELERATSLLKRAVETAPTDYRSYLMLAQLKRRTDTPQSRDESIQILRDGIKQSSAHDIALILPLASTLAEKRDFVAAEAELAPLETQVPNIAGRERGIVKLELALIRGQIINLRDGPEAAVIHLRGVLNEADIRLTERSAPQTLARGFAFLAQLYSAVGNSDLAADAYRQAVRIEPGNPNWQVQAAILAQQMGDLESAERNYRALAQSGALIGDIQSGLVEVEIQRQLQRNASDRDWQQAKQRLQSARQAGLSPVAVGLLEAKILAAAGELDKAEKTIQKLSEERPTDPIVWRSLAVLHYQKGDTAGALKATDRFKEVSKQPADAVELRAGLLAGSKRLDEAVNELSDFVSKAPTDQLPKAALTLSQLLSQAGRHADAIATLNQAHEKVPHNLSVIDALATMAWLEQNWQDLEKYESWLRAAEGDDGTLWKSFRVQRLLAKAKSIDDKEFQEAVADVDAILRERPRWSKAHYLQGEIAYRMNRLDDAAVAYGRAWEFGARGAFLADRLIDLLTRQGRLDEARQYVAQVRDSLALSPGLFDRAIPYLAQGNDSNEMVRMAQQWVDQSPKSPEARLRLGRVLLLLAESSAPEKKTPYVEQAKNEFQKAIELAPNDVRPWSAIVLLYAGSKDTRDQALPVLEKLAKQTTIDELPRDFALAQLYDFLSRPSQAQQYFRKAAVLAQANPKAAGASEVLSRTAQFYLRRVPMLAELYARRALAQDSTNGDAKIVLLTLLVNRTDNESLQEALRLIDQTAKGSIDPALETRMRATLLARQGRPQDLDAAIQLLRRSTSQDREEKLLLARIYEQSSQVTPALELCQQLVRSPNAQPAEMAEFLRFWQQHFVANAGGKTTTQFSGQAKEIYQRLGESPGQLPERLRWQLRELRARNPKREPTSKECLSVVSEVLATPAALQMMKTDARQLIQRILIVLLQEKCDDSAVQLVTAPPEGITPAGAAILLCHSYVAVPGSKDSDSKRGQAIDKLRSTHPDDAEVLEAVGDYSFVAGNYEAAVRAYQRVLVLVPGHPMTQNNLALALAELPGKTGEARQVLTLALSADPKNLDLLDTQATVDIIEKKPEQAAATLEQLVQQNPDSPMPWLHLAIAYHDMRNSDRARDSLFTAAALGIEQQVLSPRDRKSFGELQNRYLVPEMTAIAKTSGLTSSKANTK